MSSEKPGMPENILLRVPKGFKAKIQKAAQEKGLTASAFIRDALEKKLRRKKNG